MVSQVIVASAAPVVARLYTPSDYGVATVYGSVLSMAALIACARYELAIPLPDSDEAGLDVLALCLVVLAATTALSAAIVYTLGGWLVSSIHVPQLRPFLWLLPVSMLGAGCYQAMYYWGVR